MDLQTLLVQGQLPKIVDESTFNQLWALHPEQRGQVRLLGNVINTPRWHKSYINSYHFSGMNHAADPLPPILQPLLDWAKTAFQQPFNQVLLNWYQDGGDYIGPHSDDESQLVEGSPILSVSLGATRTFRIHPKAGGKKLLDIELKNGSYIIMKSPMQSYYKHSIVKVGGKKAKTVGRRINITFRCFK